MFEKAIPSICMRNGIYEPISNEQCDNGNGEGCINCIIQTGWQCANQERSPSMCSLKVIPHCGNGVYELFLN